jgi:hypothetical protein
MACHLTGLEQVIPWIIERDALDLQSPMTAKRLGFATLEALNRFVAGDCSSVGTVVNLGASSSRYNINLDIEEIAEVVSVRSRAHEDAHEMEGQLPQEYSSEALDYYYSDAMEHLAGLM